PPNPSVPPPSLPPDDKTRPTSASPKIPAFHRTNRLTAPTGTLSSVDPSTDASPLNRSHRYPRSVVQPPIIAAYWAGNSPAAMVPPPRTARCALFGSRGTYTLPSARVVVNDCDRSQSGGNPPTSAWSRQPRMGTASASVRSRSRLARTPTCPNALAPGRSSNVASGELATGSGSIHETTGPACTRPASGRRTGFVSSRNASCLVVSRSRHPRSSTTAGSNDSMV